MLSVAVEQGVNEKQILSVLFKQINKIYRSTNRTNDSFTNTEHEYIIKNSNGHKNTVSFFIYRNIYLILVSIFQHSF